MKAVDYLPFQNIDALRLTAHHGRIILDRLARYCQETPLSQPTSSGEAVGLLAFEKTRDLSGSSSED